MIDNPFPRWFEVVCYLVAAGSVSYVGAFWLLGLPGSSRGPWADVLISALVLLLSVICLMTGLATRRDRAIRDDRMKVYGTEPFAS